MKLSLKDRQNIKPLKLKAEYLQVLLENFTLKRLDTVHQRGQLPVSPY